MSLGEIKRLAMSGDELAKKVYPVRSYGNQLWILLAFLFSTFLLLSILNILSILSSLVVFVMYVPIVTLLILGIYRPKKTSLVNASQSVVFLEPILRTVFPLLSRVSRIFDKKLKNETIQVVYTKDGVLELLASTATHLNNAGKDEVKIAANALMYGDTSVGEIMTPLSMIKSISEDTDLTPKVLADLHDSGHSRFPVYKGSVQHPVGILYLKDIVEINNPKKIKDVIDRTVLFINEKSKLNTALNAFIAKKHHMFLVVNEFEDIIGVITIEDVIEQIIGKPIMDEFDTFEDLREVAKLHATKKREETDDNHV
jgi:CBS domain containing-hemolysin-like protein